MDAWSYGLLAILVLLVLYGAVRVVVGLRVFLKFQGKRVVTCPETEKAVAVRVAAGRAGAQALIGVPHLRLSQCSRWPERRDCGQECLSQIEAAPEGCLVWSIVSDWYRGRTCAYCGKLFGELSRLDRRPALLGPDGKTVDWSEVPAEKLPEVLSTHRPVCWSCHIAQTFAREHPDLVVYRPWKRGPTGEIVCDTEDEVKKEEVQRTVSRN